jgi:hypothetical protein
MGFAPIALLTHGCWLSRISATPGAGRRPNRLSATAARFAATARRSVHPRQINGDETRPRQHGHQAAKPRTRPDRAGDGGDLGRERRAGATVRFAASPTPIQQWAVAYHALA